MDIMKIIGNEKNKNLARKANHNNNYIKFLK